MTTKTMQLKCQLTHDELSQRRDEHLRALDEVTKLEEEKSSWKRRYESAQVHETTLREIVKTGQELRAVDVHDEFRAGVMATIRDDTGEVVCTRAATDKDRQTNMFHADDDEPSAGDTITFEKERDSGVLADMAQANTDRPLLASSVSEETKPKRAGRKPRATVVLAPENAK